uniref:Uncharacterized protein n=1 Tax=Kalanchoe fedtschenkoi TaxID=63787 RepID=A0A7N0ZWW8_KALFE
MTRRCSHCSFDGHNSRTCPSRAASSSSSAAISGSASCGGGGVKLFGVRLTDGSIMKKSASMGNLSSLAHYNSSPSTAAASPNPSSPSSDTIGNALPAPDGCLSDDPAHVNRRSDRKKGTPWTEEEHRLFLIGLHKLGKGDWRGIARNYVITRTPTQVASHAQKYFIRQSNASRRKRRTSLFDMTPEMETEMPPAPERFLLPPPSSEIDHENSVSLTNQNPELHSMELTPEETVKESDDTSIEEANYFLPAPVVPTFYPAYVPVPFRFWSPNLAPTEEEYPETSNHQVLKPIPVIPKDPINVDDLVGMSQLSIKETVKTRADSHPLSMRLLGSPSRQSAFRPRRSASVPNLTQGSADSNPGE